MPGYRRANHLDWWSKEALFVLSAYLCSTLSGYQSPRVASSDNIGEYLMLIFTLIRRYFSMPSWVWSRRRLMLWLKSNTFILGCTLVYNRVIKFWNDSRICGRIMYWVASVFSNSLWFQRLLLTNQYSILTIQIITRTLRLKVLV